ncbi:hypothetical protein IFM89_036177 [Coptis chinensis]|uniref:Beta-galactosidase galactose-binding domain-containing protein n=1 Tax=Coptis chinensis TaxID=261450 RepID=A0A835H1X1_9MAGN|nr:hypothetical protein IFM89_036177 [Coptis chinensis]
MLIHQCNALNIPFLGILTLSGLLLLPVLLPVSATDKAWTKIAQTISKGAFNDLDKLSMANVEVSAQYGTRSVVSSKKLDAAEKWQIYKEIVPNFADTPSRASSLPEQMGNAHGNPGAKNFSLNQQISLSNGTNNITLLSVMVGLPDSGAYLERRVVGIRGVTIQGTGQGPPQDLSKSVWGYQVGLLGEELQIYTYQGSSKVQWNSIVSSSPLTWYKATFDAPQGDDPVVLNLASMGKCEAWINGQSIGRLLVLILQSKRRSITNIVCDSSFYLDIYYRYVPRIQLDKRT